MVLRLGVVSFLNARPLIEGLRGRTDVACVFDVPAALPGRLERGEVDVALVPLIDVLRDAGRYEIVSDACIASDGETRTVRVFSQVPPARVRELCVDGDSHTSVALARVLWRERYDCELALHGLTGPQNARRQPACQNARRQQACQNAQRQPACQNAQREQGSGAEALGGAAPSDNGAPPPEAVLLIGDKVVAPRARTYAHEVDLGAAWREHTGLPFVFAVWARLRRTHVPLAGDREDTAELLSAARDRGELRAAEIARDEGPGLGWPVDLARDYLTRCMKYRLDARARAGAGRFAASCMEAGLAPPGAALDWPATAEAPA
jgi:chorismate dehydratase